MDARQLSVRKAIGRTCRWFLQSSSFVNWTRKDNRDNDHNFLWIKGKPGAGKSTLMKFLLMELRSRLRKAKGSDILLSFFFNARGGDLEKSTIGLYRSLLVQLLEAHTDLLWVLNDIRVGHLWTIESLKQTFQEALESVDDAITIVCLIDALDECDEGQIRDMVSFLSDLGITQDRLRICFASRHYPHISIQTGLSLILENDVGHSEDITSYLSTALHIGHNNKRTEKIRCELQEKASGVFMWVVLVVDILNKEYDAGREHSLLHRIRQLPKDLHDLFLDIITRKGDSSRGLLLCIQWILFARKPLSPKQLYFALLSGLEPENLVQCHTDSLSEDSIRRYILNNSKGLAESTNSESPRVQFIHESVRDFLLKDGGIGKIWPQLSTNIPGLSHHSLKQCCLTYLKVCSMEDLSIMVKFSFLGYADTGILYHAEQAQSEGLCQRDFLSGFPLPEWVKLHNFLEKHASRRYTPKVSLLYVLAEAGLLELVRITAPFQSCFDEEGERYGAPILAACALQKTAAIHAMLEIEATRVPEFSFQQFSSHFNLSSDKDDYTTSGRDWKFSGRQGLWAQISKFGSLKTSLFYLMTRECDIHQAESLLRRAIAASRAAAESMKLLISNAADVMAINKDGSTPLHGASGAGAIESMKLLISNGADVQVADQRGLTPLFAACKGRGEFEAVKLLIDLGCDVTAVDTNGQTPLHYLSFTQVAAADADGKTPLHHLARWHACPDVAEIFLDHDDSLLNAIDNKGKTPLHHHLARGCRLNIDFVKLLVERGVNVTTKDEQGMTMLHWVALRSTIPRDWRYSQSLRDIDLDVAKLLISHGADPSVVNDDGKTPLDLVSESEDKDWVALLSSHTV
ncbi:nacht and ankyrin domain-containing protein [Xylariaceae sp. FL1272]|nr:nacht and ankyrin domain-containing protein [Xylariaceae sp. FL1272]